MRVLVGVAVVRPAGARAPWWIVIPPPPQALAAVMRGLAEAEVFPDEEDRRAIGFRVADTLAQIHAVDPDRVGLGDLGRKEDYVARQLHRWQGQWEKSKTRELPAIDAVHEGDFGVMVALRGVDIVRVPLAEATTELKTVPPTLYEEAKTLFG